MTKLRTVLLIVTALAVACSSEPARLGTAGPTSPVGHFAVTADPSTDAGATNAAVGSTAQQTSGTSAWWKTGTADTAWTPVAVLANAGAGVANFTYTTDVNGLTVAATQLTPTVTGYTFVPCRAPITVISETGTATGALAGSIGNNASSYNNAVSTLASSITTAMINAGAGSTIYAAPNASVIGSSLPLFINVTGAPSGVTALTLRVAVQGFWTPTAF